MATANILIHNVGRKVAERTLHGRKYLVAPVTMIVPGVLNGSKGALYYPPDEIANPSAVDAWNGMPLTAGHPTVDGVPVSARSPGVTEKFRLGNVYKAKITSNGKLRGEAWFDVDACARVEPRVLNALRKGQRIEVSTGLFTTDVPAPRGSVINGRTYTHVARDYRPDHLAILLDQVGACNLRDGCGVLVDNAMSKMNDEKGASGGTAMTKMLAKVSGAKPFTSEVLDDGMHHHFYSDDPKASAKKVADHFAAKGMNPEVSSEKGLWSVEVEMDGEEHMIHFIDGKAVTNCVLNESNVCLNCGGKGGKPGPCPIPNAKSKSGDGRWVTTDDGNHLFLSEGGNTLMTGPKGKAVEGGGKGKAKKSSGSDDEGRYASKHNPEVIYGDKADRDSDDRYFDKEIGKAKKAESKARAKLDTAVKRGPDSPEIRALKSKGAALDTKIAGLKGELAAIQSKKSAPSPEPVKKTISDADWDNAVAGMEKARSEYRAARKAGKKGEARSRLNDARRFRKTLIGNASNLKRRAQMILLNAKDAKGHGSEKRGTVSSKLTESQLDVETDVLMRQTTARLEKLLGKKIPKGEMYKERLAQEILIKRHGEDEFYRALGVNSATVNCGGKGGKPGPCPTGGKGKNLYGVRGVKPGLSVKVTNGPHKGKTGTIVTVGYDRHHVSFSPSDKIGHAIDTDLLSTNGDNYPTRNHSPKEGRTMAAKTMTKKDAVQFLTANCDCWKGKKGAKATLNALPDDVLQSLVAAEEAKAQSELIVNAVKTRLGEKGATLTINQLAEALTDETVDAEFDDLLETEEAESVEEPTENCHATMAKKPAAPMAEAESEDEEMEGEEEAAPAAPFPPKKGKKPMPATNAAATSETKKRLTMNEWRDVAPPEVLEQFDMARRIADGVKADLVRKLVANSAARTKEQKAQLTKFLNAKTMDDLNAMAMLSVNRRAPAEPVAPQAAPIYGYGSPVVNHDADEDAAFDALLTGNARGEEDEIDTEIDPDVLPVVTANVDWKKEKELLARRK